MSNIYIIKNKINNKVYIGLTTRCIQIRFKEHLKLLKSNENQIIHKAIKKHGKENFYVELLEECDKNILDEKEKFYIKKYNSIQNGYNVTLGGRGYTPVPTTIKPSIVNEIINLYKEGQSLRNLETIYKINKSKISLLLKNNNITIRNKNNRILNNKINIDELKVLLINNKSYKDIAIHFNVSRNAISKAVSRNEL